VFKELSAIRLHAPVVGPLFIHGHSDNDVYNQFFSHLSGVLMGCNAVMHNEAVMHRSMMNFKLSTFVVYSRHLRENVCHKLDSLIGSKNSVLQLAPPSHIFSTLSRGLEQLLLTPKPGG